jgi:hypothetical protein
LVSFLAAFSTNIGALMPVFEHIVMGWTDFPLYYPAIPRPEGGTTSPESFFSCFSKPASEYATKALMASAFVYHHLLSSAGDYKHDFLRSWVFVPVMPATRLHFDHSCA